MTDDFARYRTVDEFALFEFMLRLSLSTNTYESPSCVQIKEIDAAAFVVLLVQ